MSTSLITANLKESLTLLEVFLKDEKNITAIGNAADLMIESLDNGGKVISCGNGGSMCDAMHFAEELSGKFRDDRPAYSAISISDPSHITCVANDYGFDQIFSRFLEATGRPQDVLLAVSTSGNSVNVIKAAETATKLGMKIVALTGKDGGRLAKIADVEIRAPHSAYADRAQEIHIKIIHSLIHCIENGVKKKAP